MSLLRTNGSNKKKKHGGISLNNSNLSTPLISPSRNTHEHRNKRKSHNKKMGIFAKQRESKEKARNLWGKFRRDTGGLGLGKAAFKSSSLSSLINSIDVNKTKVNIPRMFDLDPMRYARGYSQRPPCLDSCRGECC